jgi:hypothetical protein
MISSGGLCKLIFTGGSLKKIVSKNVFPLAVLESDLPISFHERFLFEIACKKECPPPA